MKRKLLYLMCLISGLYFSALGQTYNKDAKFIEINHSLDSTVVLMEEDETTIIGKAPLMLERKRLKGNILVVKPSGYGNKRILLAHKIPSTVHLKPLREAKVSSFSDPDKLGENFWEVENIYFYPDHIKKNNSKNVQYKSVFLLEHLNEVKPGNLIGESDSKRIKMIEENSAFDPVFGSSKSFRKAFAGGLNIYDVVVKNIASRILPASLQKAQCQKYVTIKPVIKNFAFIIKSFPVKGDIVVKGIYSLRMHYAVSDGKNPFDIEMINEGIINTNDPRDIFTQALFENGALLAMDEKLMNYIIDNNKKLQTDYLKDPVVLLPKSNIYIDNKNLVKSSMQSTVTIKADEKSFGSGFLVSSEGLIITNFHVVDEATEIRINIGKDTTSYFAKVLRYDEDFDVALLKIEKTGLPYLVLDEKDNSEVGDPVIAIGTPASLELGQTVSKGIISGKREIEEKFFIQTDVSISPGNSGGPLIDDKGVVVGVVVRKIIGRGYEGLGFAIPSKNVFSSLNLKYQ